MGVGGLALLRYVETGPVNGAKNAAAPMGAL